MQWRKSSAFDPLCNFDLYSGPENSEVLFSKYTTPAFLTKEDWLKKLGNTPALDLAFGEILGEIQWALSGERP
jgi:hypothetical protein